MGQKTDIKNIIQLKKKNNNYIWDTKYFEKKNNESSLYIFTNLEIKKFIKKILKDNNLMLHSYNVNISESTIKVFISYVKSLSSHGIEKEAVKSSSYSNINILTNSKKLLLRKQLKINELYYVYKIKREFKLFVKNILNVSNKNKSVLKLYLIKKILGHYLIFINYKKAIVNKFYKNISLYMNEVQNKNKNLVKLTPIQLNNFLEKFIEGLGKFTNHNYKTILLFKPINQSLNYSLTFQQLQSLKKTITQLRQFKESEFFYEGINLLFSVLIQRNSSQILADFVAIQLKNIKKRHGFFLKFLQKAASILINHPLAKVRSIKIFINGRLNNAPRSKRKVIAVNKNLSLMTLNSSTYSSQATAYGSNGTLGIKLWITEK